ncbi:MAG: hypothetical protein HNEKOMLI_00808 [Sodalis sp. Psp]|nr:hypothetical protein [Sodalis sp. Psp]
MVLLTLTLAASSFFKCNICFPLRSGIKAVFPFIAWLVYTNTIESISAGLAWSAYCLAQHTGCAVANVGLLRHPHLVKT